MKFIYAVKHNGVYYPAGADVPVGDTAVKEEPVKPAVKEPEPEPVVVKEVEKPKATPKKRNKK